jgi:hypothetical protein
MEPKLNESYSKKDFGINLPFAKGAEHIVHGELYTFFTMNGKFDNKWDGKDFIYECFGDYVVMEVGKKSTVQRHVFVREDETGPFTYYGKAKYEVRFSVNKNRIVL